VTTPVPPTRRAVDTVGPPPTGGHVLVAQTSFLGDVVLTTPLLAALHRRLQPRRVTIVVRPEAVPLVQHHPCVDAVIVDDKRGGGRGVSGALRMVGRLRRESVDVAVAPHRSLRTALVLAGARIPHRVGFAVGPWAALYHVRIPRDPRRHDVERNLSLLRAFGGTDGDPERPHLRPSVDAAARVDSLLRGLDVTPGRPLFGLSPGSVWATKRWIPEGFAQVARELEHRYGAQVLLLGSAEDAAIAARVAAATGGSVINLAGKTDLDTFLALVRRLRLLVSNDSAPMHVAAALDVPVVAVFCATTPAQGYGPYGEHVAVVQADLECRPCGRHGGPRCPRGTEDCMRLVSPATVLRAVEAVEQRAWRNAVAGVMPEAGQGTR
jgi:heptosyltransferase-2